MGLSGCDFFNCILICFVILSLQGNVLTKKVPSGHRCSVGNKLERKEDVPCKPRPQVVTIPKMQPHDVFSPTATVVNRCSGGCSNMRNCSPKKVESKCILVENKIRKTNEFRDVEEHLECSCCDVTKSMCNEKQEFLAKECICACKNKLEAVKCIDEDKDWDPVNCVCNCPEKKRCDLMEVWSDESCSCVDRYK